MVSLHGEASLSSIKEDKTCVSFSQNEVSVMVLAQFQLLSFQEIRVDGIFRYCGTLREVGIQPALTYAPSHSPCYWRSTECGAHYHFLQQTSRHLVVRLDRDPHHDLPVHV
jgi:hypothetical protein